jgi:hypothetical protein
MKTKYSDLIAKIFITAVIVVLVGLLIAWMAGLFKDKKQDLNSGTEKIDKTINSMADFDLMVYDGNTISGETLKKLISDYKTEEVPVSIGVKTLDSTTVYYNYSFSSDNLGTSVTVTPPAGKAASGYITPSGKFTGSVQKNTNDEIVLLQFTQQK